MRIMPPAAALLLALAVGLTACSSSTSGSSSSPPAASSSARSSSSTSAAPPTSATPSTSMMSSSTSMMSSSTSMMSSSAPPSPTAPTGAAGNALTPELLTPAEIGTGFQPNKPDKTLSPLPCTPHKPPLETQVPSTLRAVGLYVNAAGTVAVQETVYAYRTAATAGKALQTAEKGLACSAGTIGGAKAKIVGPIDLKSALTVKVDAAKRWDIGTGKLLETAVVALTGKKLVALQFAAEVGTDTTKFPLGQISVTAIKKVQQSG